MKRSALKVKRNKGLMKRTSLKRYISLRDSTLQKVIVSTGIFQNVLSCTGIKKVSRRQSKINYVWSKTVKICKVRCEGVCEVRGPECLYTYGITPHHVIPRARGGSQDPGNCIMGCAECHNHHKYENGIPFEIEIALELVKRLNIEHGIKAG